MASGNANRSAQESQTGALQSQTHRCYFEERFQRKPAINADIQASGESTRMIANVDFEVLGTNAGTADVTFAEGGGIKLETDSGTSDQIIITPHLDTTQTGWAGTKWSTDNSVSWGCIVNTGTHITQSKIWCGLKLTNVEVIATDANQCYFRYSNADNGGRWQCIWSNSNTDSSTVSGNEDSGVLVALSTEYKLEIKIDANRIPHFFINGKLVKVGSKDPTGLAATIDFIPYIGIEEPSDAELHIYLRRCWISMDYPTSE